MNVFDMTDVLLCSVRTVSHLLSMWCQNQGPCEFYSVQFSSVFIFCHFILISE